MKKIKRKLAVILLFSTAFFILSSFFHDPISTEYSILGNQDEERGLKLHNDRMVQVRSPHLQDERLIQEEAEKSLESGTSEKLDKSAAEINVKKPCVVAPESCLRAGNLIGREKERFADCLTDATSHIDQWRVVTGHSISLTQCSCHLASSAQLYSRVALVSLPGSGNTWVRGLLERATNVCTGAMWCDPNLRATHFCAEGLHDKTLAVKNHDSTIRWRGEKLLKRPDYSENSKPEFDAAIFIHRNPYDAMVAEYNRELGYAQWKAAFNNLSLYSSSTGHHVQSFGPEFFGKNLHWNRRIQSLMRTWRAMMTRLLIENSDHPLLLVQYEDLKSNTLHEVMRMVKFLGYDTPQEVVEEGLMQEFTAFKRNHSSTTTFEHFTTAQKLFVNTVINSVESRLKLHIKEIFMKYM